MQKMLHRSPNENTKVEEIRGQTPSFGFEFTEAQDVLIKGETDEVVAQGGHGTKLSIVAGRKKREHYLKQRLV